MKFIQDPKPTGPIENRLVNDEYGYLTTRKVHHAKKIKVKYEAY